MSRRSATELVGAGARFVGLAVQGRAALGLSRRRYLGAVWQSLRPHYFPLAAGASLTGSAAAPHVDQVWRVVAASLAAGCGWRSAVIYYHSIYIVVRGA